MKKLYLIKRWAAATDVKKAKKSQTSNASLVSLDNVVWTTSIFKTYNLRML